MRPKYGIGKKQKKWKGFKRSIRWTLDLDFNTPGYIVLEEDR